MPELDAATGGPRSLGLVANPFTPTEAGEYDPMGNRLSVRSAALGVLAAIDRTADEAEMRPIAVAKTDKVPPFYPVAALAQVMKSLAEQDPVEGVLGVYVPLDMMRVGRVRAVLSAAAERVSGGGCDLMLAAWTRKMLVEPVSSLDQWSALLVDADVTALIAELDADPAAFVARVFGAPEMTREGAEDTEVLMRVATARLDRLDSDPGEDGAVPDDEAALDDPMADAFVTPLGEVRERELPPGETVDVDALVRDYVVAATEESLSPVVARGIRAYVAQGTGSMAEELKISKAPTKTLAAILRYAQARYRATAIILDRFDMFTGAPADLRAKIASTLMELRWALKGVAILVLLIPPGVAPEVEEAFASGLKVSWEFTELNDVGMADSPYSAAAAVAWLMRASLDGAAPSWADRIASAIPEDTEPQLAYAALMRAVDVAAEQGRVPDPTDVETALGAEKEGAGA